MNQNFQYQQGRGGNRRGNQVNNQQREWPYQNMNRSPQGLPFVSTLINFDPTANNMQKRQFLLQS